MNSDSAQSLFIPPRESFDDDEVRSRVRAEFYDLRDRFLNRLACAQVFDRPLFDAFLLSLETLRRCCEAVGKPMAKSDFDLFQNISSYLEQEATYSHTQRAACAEALSQWRDIVQKFRSSP